VADVDFAPLFAGSDDQRLLFELCYAIRSPRNEAQRTFCTAWTAAEFVSSDGFETLFEQVTPLEEYAAAFATIGMPQIPPIFDRVLALIPPELRHPQNEEALFEHLRALFLDLKQLAEEFDDASRGFVPKIADYVRAHRGGFSEYM
jgi:hypothetical protein